MDTPTFASEIYFTPENSHETLVNNRDGKFSHFGVINAGEDAAYLAVTILWGLDKVVLFFVEKICWWIIF